MIRHLLLRLSIHRGIKRQRIARMVRSEAAKRGWMGQTRSVR